MDSIASQCSTCKTWYPRLNDWRKCGGCGADRPVDEYTVNPRAIAIYNVADALTACKFQIKWDPPLDEEYMIKYAAAGGNIDSFNPEHVAFLAARKAKMDEELMSTAESALPNLMAQTSIAV